MRRATLYTEMENNWKEEALTVVQRRAASRSEKPEKAAIHCGLRLFYKTDAEGQIRTPTRR